MPEYIDFMFASFLALISTYFLTFPIKKIALKFNFVDLPNYRKIHTKVTPRIGGLAIFLGSLIGLLYLWPSHDHLLEILIGSLVIVITGLLDDRYNIRPIVKLGGQFIAASILVSSGLIIEKITLPIIGMIDLGFFSMPITFLWIIGITNAINLIDGLDGLATGVSTIALSSMLMMAIIEGQLVAASLCVVIIGANFGFLYHNFYPAKIYMGDTGSNFLGYMIAAISMLGLFKNIAIYGFIIPIIVLAVPIFDTLFSIIRRASNKQEIMKADNKHIHYQLLRVGFSHRQSVIIMYGFSLLFGVLAIIFSQTSATVSFIVTIIVLFLVHLLAELAGLVLGGKRPIIDAVLNIFKVKKEKK